MRKTGVPLLVIILSFIPTGGSSGECAAPAAATVTNEILLQASRFNCSGAGSPMIGDPS